MRIKCGLLLCTLLFFSISLPATPANCENIAEIAIGYVKAGAAVFVLSWIQQLLQEASKAAIANMATGKKTITVLGSPLLFEDFKQFSKKNNLNQSIQKFFANIDGADKKKKTIIFGGIVPFSSKTYYEEPQSKTARIALALSQGIVSALASYTILASIVGAKHYYSSNRMNPDITSSAFIGIKKGYTATWGGHFNPNSDTTFSRIVLSWAGWQALQKLIRIALPSTLDSSAAKIWRELGATKEQIKFGHYATFTATLFAGLLIITYTYA